MTLKSLFIKTKLYAFLTLFLVSFWCVSQQNDSITIGVLARPYADSIALRWAPLDVDLWKKGNSLGYTITRYTLRRDNQALAIPEERIIVANAMKPKPLMEWESLATKNTDAAVLAQALYGDNFVTTAPGSDVGTIMAINDEKEQRFTFAMLAAEQNYKAAKLAALGFTDTDTKANETYLYKVQVSELGVIEQIVAQGAIVTGNFLFEPLPIPYGAIINFGDREAKLQWNYGLLKSIYSRYSVERSEDGKTFKPLNGKPIFNAQTQGQGQNENLMYRDSIPNEKLFYYRVKGQTAFDESGPYSKVVKGMAQPNPNYAPIVERASFEGENGVRIFWSFDTKEEKTIKGFQLRRANSDKGNYEIIGNIMAADKRETSYASLRPTNYFKVVAIGKNGLERPSFAKLVQPIDSLPPNMPKGLKGQIDTLGIVRLSWDKNIEKDMLGYRIYRANRPENEFSQITSEETKENSYTDTLSLTNLNKAIYYRITAEDYRFNTSKLSEILKISIPDKIPPSFPVLKGYELLEEGIQLSWIPSSSKDVQSHAVYRKNMGSSDTPWEMRYESISLKDTTYIDTSDLEQGNYSYTIIAKDSIGLESKPTNPITIAWKGKIPLDKEIKFSGTVNRELRFINLNWKIKTDAIVSYRLYRGIEESDLKLYKTLDKTAKGYNDISLEINSNYTYGLQLVLNDGRITPIKKISLKY